MADPREIAQRALDASLEAKRALAGAAALRLAELGAVWTRVLGAGGKILLCGNGGSAADAQHLAAELVGRYLRDRGALPAVALTVDTSILTAVANDYGYDAVFARQVEALGRKGDLLVALTTSGNSRNVLRAIEAAQARGLETMALTGAGGGQAAALADYCFTAPSDATPRIQECHILVGHVLCEIAEASRDD